MLFLGIPSRQILKMILRKKKIIPGIVIFCYTDAAQKEKRLFDDLVANPEHSLGKMSLTDLDRVCTVAANSTIISPKNVNRFGLTGYLLQK